MKLYNVLDWNENVISSNLTIDEAMSLINGRSNFLLEEIDNVGEMFARKCDFTGEGMNEGWCFGDGETYAKYEADAISKAIDMGYESLQDAFDDDAVYWTEWEDKDDYQYILINDKLTEIDS